ncbi:hypothetical protein D9611_000516 [Ephemerocybe angulata]|uniref:Uncharacterized protein n=1 Tax=Ephemerocybe angulata TaxID=980116 RepID=A0A8H5BNJ5_9AGAR|nr:hypothetical protein D9611_000516 [Tulosesus angulatus]
MREESESSDEKRPVTRRTKLEARGDAVAVQITTSSSLPTSLLAFDATYPNGFAFALLPPPDAFPIHAPAHQPARREQSFWTAPTLRSEENARSAASSRRAPRKIEDEEAPKKKWRG